MSDSTASFQYVNRATRKKREQIIEIVRNNPEITGAEIIQRCLPEKPSVGSDKRTRATLQNLCGDGELKWLEGDRYIAIDQQ